MPPDQLGNADVMIGAGTESMTVMTNMMGNKVVVNPAVFAADEQRGIAFGMGLTAERSPGSGRSAARAQDALRSNPTRKACAAIAAGHFQAEISPCLRRASARSEDRRGADPPAPAGTTKAPAPMSAVDNLGRLKPVFHARGTVTAGNAPDVGRRRGGVAGVREDPQAVQPDAAGRFCSYAVAGCRRRSWASAGGGDPEGAGAGGHQPQQLDWIELNEAFAAQALAVMHDLELDPARVNPLGGAIALGHPLGATGRSAPPRWCMACSAGRRYGMISMCIGTGMGRRGFRAAVSHLRGGGAGQAWRRAAGKSGARQPGQRRAEAGRIGGLISLVGPAGP